jgi:hypothetical protein
MNQIKAITRAGMGACGGKTCMNLILQLFRQEGVAPQMIIGFTQRPLFVEALLGVFSESADELEE